MSGANRKPNETCANLQQTLDYMLHATLYYNRLLYNAPNNPDVDTRLAELPSWFVSGLNSLYTMVGLGELPVTPTVVQPGAEWDIDFDLDNFDFDVPIDINEFT